MVTSDLRSQNEVGALGNRSRLRLPLPRVRDRGALVTGVIAVVAGIILLVTGPWIVGLVLAVLGIAVAAIALRG